MALIHYQFDPFVYARRRAEKGELQYGCAELIYLRSSSEVTASSRCSFSLMRARVGVATERNQYGGRPQVLQLPVGSCFSQAHLLPVQHERV